MYIHREILFIYIFFLHTQKHTLALLLDFIFSLVDTSNTNKISRLKTHACGRKNIAIVRQSVYTVSWKWIHFVWFFFSIHMYVKHTLWLHRMRSSNVVVGEILMQFKLPFIYMLDFNFHNLIHVWSNLFKYSYITTCVIMNARMYKLNFFFFL